MKKHGSITKSVLIVIIVMNLMGCGSTEKTTSPPAQAGHSGRKVTSTAPVSEISKAKPSISNQVCAVINDKEFTITMYDNAAAAEFMSQLPLTLTFQDFHGSEKISMLDHTLPSLEPQSTQQFHAGSFAYYKPWGNVLFAYEDLTPSQDLIALGYMEGDIDILTKQTKDFKIYFRRI